MNTHEYKYTLHWDLDRRREGSDHTFRSATTVICILEFRNTNTNTSTDTNAYAIKRNKYQRIQILTDSGKEPAVSGRAGILQFTNTNTNTTQI